MFRPTTASVADAVDFSGPERFVSKLFKSLLRIYRWLISYRGGSPSHVEKIPSPGKNCIWSNFSSCIPYVELDDRLAVKTLENWCLGLRRHTPSLPAWTLISIGPSLPTRFSICRTQFPARLLRRFGLARVRLKLTVICFVSQVNLD